MIIRVERMPREELHGDWHDKPCRWQVVGPGAELQKFSTRDDARLYARVRRASPDNITACSAYCRG